MPARNRKDNPTPVFDFAKDPPTQDQIDEASARHRARAARLKTANRIVDPLLTAALLATCALLVYPRLRHELGFPFPAAVMCSGVAFSAAAGAILLLIYVKRLWYVTLAAAFGVFVALLPIDLSRTTATNPLTGPGGGLLATCAAFALLALVSRAYAVLVVEPKARAERDGDLLEPIRPDDCEDMLSWCEMLRDLRAYQNAVAAQGRLFTRKEHLLAGEWIDARHRAMTEAREEKRKKTACRALQSPIPERNP